MAAAMKRSIILISKPPIPAGPKKTQPRFRLMYQKSFVLCSATALLAVAVACSKSSPTPVSPAANGALVGEAAADGSTLKVTAPTPQSPINGAQPQSLTLVAGASTAQFASALPALTYEFQVLTTAGTTVCSATASPSGNTVTATPACALAFDTNHRWRVRARMGQAFGPWSSEASFRSPLGGYNTGSEIYDPLYTGTTVGQIGGSTTFINGTGLRFNGHDSKVSYLLSPALQQGEISVMVTGIDEGNPGDKTKVFSMQEGNGGDITDNDYRMTVEKRGRDYVEPGATTWRIITGDAGDHGRIFDGNRVGVAYSDERWYFWQFRWQTGSAQLVVREDGPNGRVIYNSSAGTGGNPYRPLPHYVHLGTNVGRAGPIDASIPGAIYKNLWVSSKPRPQFPNE